MSDIDRRVALKLMGAAGAATVLGCTGRPAQPERDPAQVFVADEGKDALLDVTAMGPRWETSDPFLFCAHHDDRYPAGNERFGPAASLAGRRMGMDFEGKDGWRMYHGEVVPGFPRHPHRGFETVTVVRRGLLDHSDSLGARARYGGGDVQWLTAGRGINHAEMFPLLDRAGSNHLELFQIWLNLPKVDKMVEPRFAMLWNDTIPRSEVVDRHGRTTRITVVAGTFGDVRAPTPPPNSWASRDDTDVAIWTIKMAPGAQFRLPPAAAGSHRSLYVFRGTGLAVGGHTIPDYHRVQVRADGALGLQTGGAEVEILMLQGRPISEPIARRGPFVMNTMDEIRQAYADYQRTGFGGWPWEGADPVHGPNPERFARLIDGSIDRPT